MFEIDKNKVQIKYLTGYNKFLEGYPTPLDILFDACADSVDGTFYSEAKLENRYKLDENGVAHVLKTLSEQGYIKKKTKNYKIVSTPWD